MDVRDTTLRGIIKIARKYKFNNEQIKRMIAKYTRFYETENVLENYYQKYKNSMECFGFSLEEINEIISYNPTLIYHHFVNWDEYLSYFKGNVHIGNIDARCLYNKIVELLEDLEINNNSIERMIHNNCEILYYPSKILKDNKTFYLNKNIPKKMLCELIQKNPNLLTLGNEDWHTLEILLKEFDLTLYDFLTMFTRKCKSFDLNLKKYEQIFAWVLEKKINKKKVADYIKQTPVPLDLTAITLEERYNCLFTFGFNEKQVKHIVDNSFGVLTMENEKVQKKMDVMNEYGYTEEEKIHIVSTSPFYLGLTVNNLRKKFDAAKQAGVLRYFVRRPKALMQGAELALARYYYLKSYYPEELIGDYASLIYSSKEKFKNKFTAENNYLLIIYRDRKKIEKRLARKKK